MIIYRQKYFSQPQKPIPVPASPSQITPIAPQPGQPKDIGVLKGVGKTGMQIGAGLGALALAETGRSAWNASRGLKETKDLINSKEGKNIKSSMKKILHDKTKYYPGLEEEILKRGHQAREYMPKYKGINKAERALHWWNRSSNLSRTVLDNMENYTKTGLNALKKNQRLSPDEIKALDKLPGLSRRIAKTGTALKNAKGLAKAGLVLGQAGGLLYLNGRSLESGGGMPVTK